MPEFLRDEARRAIECLQLPGVVLRAFDGELIHPALQHRVESPYCSFTDGSGLEPGFLPFWECGTLISGYSRSLGQYQVIHLEAPEKPSFSSPSFRGLFCYLLISLWEDECDDSTLIEIAALFEMPPVDQVLYHLETQPPPSSEWDRWKASVIEQYENS